MKLINKRREKLINALLYFIESVNYPSKTKLIKLLYLLDFMHFKQVGRPVTGLKYYAWDFGPVPRELFFELDEKKMPDDLAENIRIANVAEDEGKKYLKFYALKKTNLELFTPRERELLEKIACIYKELKPTEISEITHLKNEPWSKTIETKGKNALIDYSLAIDNEALIDLEEAMKRFTESEEMWNKISG